MLIRYISKKISAYRRGTTVIVVSLVGGLLTLTIFAWGWQASLTEYRGKFNYDATTRSTLIFEYFRSELEDLSALKRFIEGTDHFDSSAFQKFVKPILERKGAQAVEWIPAVPLQLRAAMESIQVDQSVSAHQITEQASDGSLVPASKRDIYYPVYYVEPIRGNEKAVGFDLGSNQQRLEAIRASLRSGHPQATSRITLVQEKGKQFSFLVFVPVYALGMHKGFALGVFRAEDMLENAIQQTSPLSLETTLEDLSAPSAERFLAKSTTRNKSGMLGTFDPTSVFFPLLSADRPTEMAGRKWNVTVSATPGYRAGSVSMLFLAILPCGTLLTLALVLYLDGVLSHRDRAEVLVCERTAHLAEANETLGRANQHLQQVITEHELTAKQLKESERRYSALFTNKLNAIAHCKVITDENGRPVDYWVLQVNDAYERIKGIKKADIEGRRVKEVFPDFENNAFDFVTVFGKIALEGGEILSEAFFERTQQHLAIYAYSPLPGEFTVIFTDITERKRAEEALSKSEQRFRAVVEDQTELIFRYRPDGSYTFINTVFCRFFDKTEEEVVGTKWQPDAVADDIPMSNKQMEALSPAHPVVVIEKRVMSGSGDIHWMQLVNRGFFDEMGHLVETQTVGRDITRRKQAEMKLEKSEDRFHKIFDESPIGIALLGKQREIILTNRRYREFLGYSESEIIEQGPVGILHPDDWEASLALSNQLRSGEIPLFHMEQRYIRKDGEVVWSDTNITVLRDNDGQLIFTIGWVQDITERKKSEEKLRKLSQAVEQSPASIAITDRKGDIEYVNPAFCKMTGYTVEELLGSNPRVLKTGQTAAEEYRNLWETITGGNTWQGKFCNRKKNGELFWESACIAPVFDDKGTINHFVAIKEDITGRKQVEDERTALESQLMQAQKLESIGRLAGGVAHDFNNMLTVILGHASLALMGVEPSHPINENLTEISKAAGRSTDLTRQLLAFARKQTISPRLLDLNKSLLDMHKMLQRLIGENIRLTLKTTENPCHLKMDPSQIDQILANLCVNSRDAMIGIGSIVIQTGIRTLKDDDCANHAGAMPGDYVLLSLSDDGCGMDSELLPRIFEPFFTTKGVGEGTGLGLATVYGIVKQNNGFIYVDSEPNKGTTFNIYLPRYAGEAGEGRTGDAAEPILGGRETILLVEDESAVLKLTSGILTNLGYFVLRAGTPNEAVQLVKEHSGKIQLILSDVVMPEMNGRDLANKLLASFPQIKSLFMSGYTADIIARHGVLDDDINFIHKPFTIRDLANKVREVLDCNKVNFNNAKIG